MLDLILFDPYASTIYLICYDENLYYEIDYSFTKKNYFIFV